MIPEGNPSTTTMINYIGDAIVNTYEQSTIIICRSRNPRPQVRSVFIISNRKISKLSVSNPKSKYVAYLPVLSQISNCQGLGRKNKHEILKTDHTMKAPRTSQALPPSGAADRYGKFSKFQVCFCGLDPGNLKFETVRTNKQCICFWDLRRSI